MYKTKLFLLSLQNFGENKVTLRLLKFNSFSIK